MCGTYPAADALPAGTEISSTYEGRHIEVLESEITHPTHADGFVDKGDACVVGAKIVGVAFTSAVAATDLIALDTEGIWVIDCVAVNDAGNSAIAPGDELFINKTTCVVSKITNAATQIPFGYALGAVTSGSTLTIAVKVHFDPTVETQRILYNTVTSGAYGKQDYGILAGGASEGVARYMESHITAAITGHTYGAGSWVNVDAASLLAAGFICTPWDVGVYAGDAQASARIVFAGQATAILAGAPASLHAWRLNTTQTITALIAAANAGSVGYAASVGTTSTKVGDLPLVDVVGHGVRYVRLYDAAG